MPSFRLPEMLVADLEHEVRRQDEKHGSFKGFPGGSQSGGKNGAARLAIACLEDEVEEAKQAWRSERGYPTFVHTREELLQVAACAMRAVRDLTTHPPQS